MVEGGSCLGGGSDGRVQPVPREVELPYNPSHIYHIWPYCILLPYSSTSLRGLYVLIREQRHRERPRGGL